MSTFDPVYSHNSEFDDYWNDKGTKSYYKLMKGMLRRDPAEQTYRRNAYETLGSQTMAAEQAAQRGGVSAFGLNNPSGVPAALMVRANMSAPYGAADLEARQAGRQSTLNTGQQLLNAKQQHANWYATLESLKLREDEIEAQVEIAKAQAAAQAASAAAAGG